ncbi:MAG: hypothetical protein JRF17_01425 [Deltaproteobacteria bacterium]|jgi:hypothetical protein|nr:hypothetical protein [Deltaproteobacteria bacterium]
MIEKKYAYALLRSPNLKYDKILIQTQRDAMSAKKGCGAIGMIKRMKNIWEVKGRNGFI